MPRISYTAEGFRAAWRRPSLTLAEITWRWVVGVTAMLLAAFALCEYLGTLPVTNGELLFLRTRQPIFVGQVLSHILRGSANRAVAAAVIASLALCALWIFAASAGRLVTIRELLEYFASRRGALDVDAESSVSSEKIIPKANFGGLVRLNFLRAAATLAAMLSFVGAAIVAGFASPAANPRPGFAFFVFLPLAGLVVCVWSSLNWLLSLASIFAVRDRKDAAGAIFAAVAFVREQSGPVFAVGTWTGLAHIAAWAGASSVIFMPLGFAPILPWRLVAIAVILLSLAYFALADWLYMARLAGYVCIVEMPNSLDPAPVPPPILAPPSTIDRDEPILSDLPNLAVQT